MHPSNVNPGNFSVHKIIYISPDGTFSIAKGIWVEDQTARFAMRWNFDLNNPDDKGYPATFGNPMWFQLPKNNIKGIIDAILNDVDDYIINI